MNYNERLAAIRAEIAPVLADGLDPETYASGMLEDAQGDEQHFEVRGLHTKTGAPHAFTI